MSDELSPMPARRGRAASQNPANRFEPIERVEDPAALDEEELRQVPTTFFKDTSRSVLAQNDSPDIPFTYSINPYRGCEHGCAYCLSGDTAILMADGTTRPISELKVGDQIYGTKREGWYRRFTKTQVLDYWQTTRKAYRITLADGTTLIASGDHRFLTERGWKFVTGMQHGAHRRPHLTTNNKLMGIVTSPEKRDIAVQTRNAIGELQVTSIESLGRKMPMYDITTGTGDFIANGVVSHNCYARPSHEYLGWSAGLDFETKILVKENAPRLLSEAFQKPSWKPQIVTLSGNTDPYQPAERRFELSRQCLEVFLKHRNPVGIITKNALITRDIDLLQELAELDLVHVTISVTSLRNEIINEMEPRSSRPAARLKAIEKLAEAGVSVGVNAAPIVPGLTDEELPAILKAAAERGATTAGYIPVRLPGAVQEVFTEWIERAFPRRADKVLSRIASMRGGKLNDARFGKRMRGEGLWAETLEQLFTKTCRKLGLNCTYFELSTEHFRRLPGGQMDLF